MGLLVILSDLRWSADLPHNQVTGVSHAAAEYKPVENEKAQTLRKVGAVLLFFTEGGDAAQCVCFEKRTKLPCS